MSSTIEPGATVRMGSYWLTNQSPHVVYALETHGQEIVVWCDGGDADVSWVHRDAGETRSFVDSVMEDLQDLDVWEPQR